MSRRSRSLLLSALLGAGLAAGFAPAAGAQVTPGFSFEHDRTLDGTAAERESGYFALAGNDVADPPDLQRAELPDFLDLLDDPANGGDGDYTPPPAANLFEAFEFTVGDDEVNGSFSVQLNWGNPNIDFDLYVYRQRPDGTFDGDPVATAATADPQETATYVSPTIDSPVEPGTYAIFVDNWCSSDTDATSVELNEDVTGPLCDIGPYDDEDDFTGRVAFAPLVLANRAPTGVRLAGPSSGTAGDRLTFTASATDPDGRITGYAFDLDGDGNFEYDNAASAAVTKLYDQPGSFNVGVRVIDDRGGVAYASRLVTIAGAPVQPILGATKPVAPRNLLRSFRLNAPVFGGRRGRSLVIRYQTRETAMVEVGLYRGVKKLRRVRRLFRGERTEGRPNRLKVRSKGLRRGIYTVRILVRAEDGRRKVFKLRAKRI